MEEGALGGGQGHWPSPELHLGKVRYRCGNTWVYHVGRRCRGAGWGAVRVQGVQVGSSEGAGVEGGEQ